MANKFVLYFLVLIIVGSVQVSRAGTVAYSNRDTSLDELKSIDSYVSSALPVLQDGFFIDTSRGPILVKNAPHPGAPNKRPKVRTGYYHTLPRLIPVGFEGVAVSHFNLGPASAIKPYSFSKDVAVPAATQSQQYIATPSQTSSQYVSHQPHQQQLYYPQQSQQQQQQYVAESQQPQQYVETQQPHQQQYFAETQQPQQIYEPQAPQYPGEAQQNQQQQYEAEAQQQQSQQYLAEEAQRPQQYIAQPQQQLLPEELPQQQVLSYQQPQSYISPPSQQQLISEHEIIPQQQQQPVGQQPLERTHTHVSTPVAQPSFQVDNLLRPDQDQGVTTAFQTQIFGAERFQSQRLTRNNAVLQTTEFEETLPETLRNKFYKNSNLATILAQESLPVHGETIVSEEWDTNKIAKGKIHALLSGAGLI